MGSVAGFDTALPPGAWDSHVHVCDPGEFPFHPLRPYTPKKADVNDLLAFQRSQGVFHSCLVAFSVHGTDNTSILSGLKRLNGKGRAVVSIDPQAISDKALLDLHEAGVRGIRVNLRTTSERLGKTALAERLSSIADRVRHLGWVVQLYVALDQIKDLAEVIPGIGLPVVIDHIGHPDPSKGPAQEQEGYSEFMSLLRSRQVWTKLSGTYRFETLPGLDSYVHEILSTAPDMVVWASDWPHSGGVSANPGGDRFAVQEYRAIDDQAWIARCKAWCHDAQGGNRDDLVQKIWVDNPRRLWQYHGED